MQGPSIYKCNTHAIVSKNVIIGPDKESSTFEHKNCNLKETRNELDCLITR